MDDQHLQGSVGTAAPESLRVLLVEDNPGDADLASEAFASSEPGTVQLVHAATLSGAIAALRGGTGIDAVLLDLSLPDAAGLEGVRRLHADWPEMPFVVLTGQASEEMGARAVAAGAQDYLIKGQFSPLQLLRAVRYATVRHRYARALAEERAARAAAEAEQAVMRQDEKRKDQFLALLAHELRDPLAPILTCVELMRGPAEHAERASRAAVIIEKQVRHMVRLIDDLLDVSRITRGKITLKREHLDLAAVVSAAIELARPLIDSSGHELVVSLPQDPVLVEGDKTRLTQVVANLLNNAAKYTHQRGGTIRLTMETDRGQAMVRIADTGIGIDPDDLPRLFELFVQGDASLERSRGGLGVGLALARSLVELHGGSIEGSSAGAGQGSEFVVRLPLTGPARMAHAQPPREPKGSSHTLRLRVLVVDDNADAAESLSELLEAMGYEARAAGDGPAAIRLAEEYRPEAVLLDIGMPGMNGYEVARRLRQMPATRSALLVALTGHGQEEDRRRALEAGFDHHLTKPADPMAVNTLLRQTG